MVEITYHKEGDFFVPNLYLEKEEYAKDYVVRERVCNVRNLMDSLKFTLDQALDALKNPRHRAEIDNRPITEAVR